MFPEGYFACAGADISKRELFNKLKYLRFGIHATIAYVGVCRNLEKGAPHETQLFYINACRG